jgi:hypothetical protein
MENLIKSVSILTLAVFAVSATAADFHVSPKGNDALGNGSSARPFASPARALVAARADNSTIGDHIILHTGEYALDATLTLTPADSGSPEKPFVIEAAPGEKPELSGARPITGWTPLAAAIPGITEKAKGKLFVADVAKGWRFHYLFVDGQRAQRSRLVNTEQWRQWNKDHVQGAPEKAGQLVTFTQNKAALKGLPSNGDIEMPCMMLQFGWFGTGVLTDINAEKGTARWNSTQTNIIGSRNGGERGYNLENAIQFIDEPGEWAVDTAVGKVYYWPKEGEDMAKAKVVAPHLCEIVRLQGTRWPPVMNVRISGITLKYTDRLPENEWPHAWLKRQWENTDAAIYGEFVGNIAVENCRILHPGAYGVTFKYFAMRNRIEGNEIGWTGSGGVYLEGNGPGDTGQDVNRGNMVRRNWIHDLGLGGYWHSAGVQMSQTGNNLITHNLIQRSAYCAISMVGTWPAHMNEARYFTPGQWDGQVDQWNMYNIRGESFSPEIQKAVKEGKCTYFNRETAKDFLFASSNYIARNIVVEPEQLLDEGGALYAWCVGKGNIWSENIIFKSSGFPGSSILALDDVAEYFTIADNVIWVNGSAACGTIGMRQSERANSIFNNVRVNFKPGHGDGGGGNLNGLANAFYRTDAGREPLDKLLKKIQSDVDIDGGWMGKPALGIPAPGEPITKGREKAPLPKDSHKTIE